MRRLTFRRRTRAEKASQGAGRLARPAGTSPAVGEASPDEDRAVDPGLTSDRSNAGRTARKIVQDIGRQVVDDREDDRADHDTRNRSEPATTTIARMKIEKEYLNWPG